LDKSTDDRSRSITADVWTCDGDQQGLAIGCAPVARSDISRISGKCHFIEYLEKCTYIQGIAYISLPKPTKDLIIKAQIDAVDIYNRRCQSYCRNASVYQVCDGAIRIGDTASTSSNLSFSHDLIARRFLDATIVGHRNAWRVDAPFIVFLCRNLIDARSPIVIANAVRPAPPSIRHAYVWLRVLVLDRQQPFMTSVHGAKIESRNRDDASDIWMASIDETDIRSPYDHSIVYVRARNPHRSGGASSTVNISIAALNRDGYFCESKCVDDNVVDEQLCIGDVHLNASSNDTSSLPYTDDETMRPFLGWTLTGHPTQWTHQLTTLHFYC
jgi:hypothetical protein